MYLSNGVNGKNDWWRYLLGIIIIFAGYLLGQVLMYAVVIFNAEDYNSGILALQNFEESMDFTALHLSKNTVFFLLISMFIFALGALFLVVRFLHDKEIKKFITPFERINISKIIFGFTLWFGISLGLELINYVSDPQNYLFSWNPQGFLPLLLISIFLLPIQTSFEELFFRGYIMQGLSFLFKNKWVPILLSSILFGLVHGTNPEVAKYGFWTMQIYYVLAGLFLAIITVMDDGLELALGVHAATNIFGATLFTYEGSVLQTDSLFISFEINPWLMTYAFLIASIAFILICRKKYSWPEFTSLFENIKSESV
ncbi:MAG: CPBP family intramembrane metalloprotease [Saprospiraceae bacterium]|jgi:membrane protease YdiL (CAAX protease family)|nr:CPBP family intramembrane metalloprotease [Saprospiraceae bacterium]MBL0026133.1 CPBP family intramembrane metalloprotease [Saprospiraceae bacterium]